MGANDASVMADKTNDGRPLVVSVAATVIFLLGLTGLLLAIIAGVGAVLLHVDLPAYYVLALVFWYTTGPCLILAGYNLWKQKKWAAQLAATIILLDVASAIGRGNISALAVDMLFLVLHWPRLDTLEAIIRRC